MEDLLSDVGGWWNTVILAVSAVLTWAGSRLEAWKAQPKGMRVIIAVCAFLAIAILLSVIQGLFS